jgi:hypothetical protein
MSRIRVAAAALLLSCSGSALAAGPGLPIPVPTIPGLALPALMGSLPSGAPSLGLPALTFDSPQLTQLLGNATSAMSPYAQQLPLVGLVEAGDPVLRPIITPLSDTVYIPVLGAAFGNN